MERILWNEYPVLCKHNEKAPTREEREKPWWEGDNTKYVDSIIIDLQAFVYMHVE